MKNFNPLLNLLVKDDMSSIQYTTGLHCRYATAAIHYRDVGNTLAARSCAVQARHYWVRIVEHSLRKNKVLTNNFNPATI